MNKKYVAVALYHTVINYQLDLVVEALEELGEYNPKMYEMADHMRELVLKLEEEGRRLLERIERECENAN